MKDWCYGLKLAAELRDTRSCSNRCGNTAHTARQLVQRMDG